MLLFRRVIILLTAIYIFASLSVSAYAASEEVIKIYSDARIDRGSVVDDVVVMAGSVVVDGRVEHNIVVFGGDLTLNSGSYVGEDVVIVAGELFRSPGAEVRGKVTRIYIPRIAFNIPGLGKGGFLAFWAAISILVFIGFIGLTILLMALIPRRMAVAVDMLDRSLGASFVWGVVWMLLIVPIAIFLVISILGIVLLPLEVLFVVVALILGYIASAAFIGRRILAAFNKAPFPFVDAIIGMLVLFFVGFIPVAGDVVRAVFLVAGFGAVISTRLGGSAAPR